MSQFVKQAISNMNNNRNIIHSKDIWHVSRNIPARWRSFLNKKKKEAQKKQFDLKLLNDLEDFNTTKLKTHYWYWATQKLNPMEFKNQLCNATDYWTKRIGLSKEQSEVINQFFLTLVDDEPQQYSDGLSSALCESLHSMNNRYCPKGWKYSTTVYETRKNLAVLDWNNRKENIPANKWKKNLIDNFLSSFNTISTNNNQVDPMEINDN
jgi:hypothetical protein